MDHKDLEIKTLRELLEKEQIKVKKAQRKNRRLHKLVAQFMEEYHELIKGDRNGL